IVDDASTEAFEMIEKLERVEDSVTVTAQVRRRAHPVEDNGVRVIFLTRIVAVTSCVKSRVGNCSPIEFGEEWSKPIGVLVVDGQWFCVAHCLCSVSISKDKKRAAQNERLWLMLMMAMNLRHIHVSPLNRRHTTTDTSA